MIRADRVSVQIAAIWWKLARLSSTGWLCGCRDRARPATTGAWRSLRQKGMMVFVHGHFGEWLQGCVGPARVVALVTLACPVRGVHVARARGHDLQLDDPSGVLPLAQCREFLRLLGCDAGHALTLRPDLPPGGGAGMSTAALVAVARACGADPARIASACLAVEGACDPLMLPQPDSVLWAARSAEVLAPLPPPPVAAVLGGFFGPVTPTDPQDHDFPLIDDLVAEWSKAPTLARAAQIATESARRTSTHRGPKGDPTDALAADLGALGWARAHTGSARALIFAPDAVPPHAAQAMVDAGLTLPFQFQTGHRI